MRWTCPSPHLTCTAPADLTATGLVHTCVLQCRHRSPNSAHRNTIPPSRPRRDEGLETLLPPRADRPRRPHWSCPMVPMVKLLARATIRDQFRLCPWQLHLGAPRRRVGTVTGSEPQSQAPPVPGSYFTLARDQWPLSTQSGGNTATLQRTVHTPATRYYQLRGISLDTGTTAHRFFAGRRAAPVAMQMV